MPAKSKEIKPKEKNVIALRVNQDLLKQLEQLEKIRGGTKSDLIKEAIASSFNSTLTEGINEKIYEFLKEIFVEIKLKTYVISIREKKEEKEEKENPFKKDHKNEIADSSLVEYEIGDKKYITLDKEVHFNLNKIKIGLDIKQQDRIVIKFLQQDIISGKIQSVKPEILKKIIDIITKHNFIFEAKNDSKNEIIRYSLRFEREVGLFESEKWKDKFKEDLIKIKKIISEISSLLDKNRQIKKERSVQDQ